MLAALYGAFFGSSVDPVFCSCLSLPVLGGFPSLPVVHFSKWRVPFCGLSVPMCCVALREVLVGDCLLNKNDPNETFNPIADAAVARYGDGCLHSLRESSDVRRTCISASVRLGGPLTPVMMASAF